MTHRLTTCFLLLTLATGSTHAHPRLKIPQGEDRTLDILVRVPAPAARCMALSETHKLLAVGHHPRHSAAHVSLFRLDASGNVQGEPVTIKLPRPDTLPRLPNTTTGLAFHPTRPLLYVWQDIVLPRTPQNQLAPLLPVEEAALPEFDHLFIYRLNDGQPRLLVSLCRLPEFAYGRPQGSLCVDQTGERLYVPNLRGDQKNPKVFGCICGSYVLDSEGLPVIGKEPEEERPNRPPDTKAADAAARAIADAGKAGKPVLPQRLAPYNGEIAPDLPLCATGLGWVPLGRDLVLFGGYHDTALVTWAPDDRRVRVNLFQPPGTYQYHFPAGHPNLPVVYIGVLNTQTIYRIEHVDGQPTLAPQSATVLGAGLQSPPVVMGKHNLLAIGTYSRILLMPLDAQGRLKPERTQVLVGNQAIEALAYSEKFDRLYVGMEKAK
jgi:hypothetical protein